MHSIPLLRASLLAALLGLAGVFGTAPPASADPPPDAAAARTLIRQGEALRAAGRYPQAVVRFEAARQTAEPKARTLATLELGWVRLLQRHWDEAAELLVEARDRALELKEPMIAAWADNYMGTLATREGQFAEAARLYQDARADALKAGDAALAATVLLNQGRMAVAEGKRPALPLFTQAAKEAAALPDDREAASLLLAVAKELRELERTGVQRSRWMRPAHEALTQARQRAARTQEPRLISQAEGQLGELYELDGRRTEAMDLTRRALDSLGSTEAHDLALQWEWQRARLLEAAKAWNGATEAYRRAVYHIEAIRSDIPVEYADGRSSFRETLSPIYLGLANRLLRTAENADKAAPALLREARNVVERIKVAELQDYFLDACVVERRDGASLDRPPAGVAVLYPIVLPDRVALLVSSDLGIHQVVAQVRQTDLEAAVGQMRKGLQTRPNHHYRTPARQIHDWLIRPLEAILRTWGTDTLVIVPDGKLRNIPFATLYDGQRFLIEKYAIATSPGLELTDSAPAGTDRKTLLAGLSQGVQGFSPLPGVPKELDAIQRLSGGERLLNEQYSADAVGSRLKASQVSYIHLATHGQFTGDPNWNFLLTYNDLITMDELQQLIGQGRARERPLELLSLSACQTAIGDDRASLGLGGIAVQAGARSAIATLWFVDDEATALAMTGFYREIFSPHPPTKAKALQKVQRAMLADPRFRHPAYWGPFLLIGNWL